MLQSSVLYRGHHLRAQAASILGCWSCRGEVQRLFLCVVLGKAPPVPAPGVGRQAAAPLHQAFPLPRTLLQELWHSRCRENEA